MIQVGKRVKRLLIVAPGHLRVSAERQLEGDSSEWEWLEPDRFLESLDRVDTRSRDLCLSVNTTVSGDPRLRDLPLGVVEVRAGAVRPAAASTEEFPVILCTAYWTPNGRAHSVILQRRAAHVDRRDSWRDILDREAELTTHVLLDVLRALQDGEGGLEDMAAGPDLSGQETARSLPYRRISGPERLRWRLAVSVRKLFRDLRPRTLVKRIFALGLLLLVRPIRDWIRSIRRCHPVRIFTFHRVTALSRDALSVPPRVFEHRLLYISRHHEIVDLQTALELLEAGARLERPVAVITFDDAYRSVYEWAAPLMDRYGLTGCCFVVTDFADTTRRFPWDTASLTRSASSTMGWAELQELREAGWTIGSHSASHRRLADCDATALRHELEGSLATMRARLGVRSAPLAFPFGDTEDIGATAPEAARRLGYTACLSNHGGENRPGTSPYDLCRIDIGGDLDTLAWKTRVHGFDVRARTGRLRESGDASVR